MIGLGIFILLVVGLASLAVVFGGGQSVHIDMPWFTINTSVSVVFLEAAGAVFGSAAAFGTAAETPGASRPGTVPSLSGKPVTGPPVLAGTAISGPTVVCDSPTAVIAM